VLAGRASSGIRRFLAMISSHGRPPGRGEAWRG
jgi:hypothetical protein